MFSLHFNHHLLDVVGPRPFSKAPQVVNEVSSLPTVDVILDDFTSATRQKLMPEIASTVPHGLASI
jgi:hypothetical protein